MTRLLISVKNVEESLRALYAGASIIDLKDPAVGALGALAAEEVEGVLAALENHALTSATVGENHNSIDALVSDIRQYAGMGVHFVKIAVSDLLLSQQFFVEMKQLTSHGIKLIAVFFADKKIDFSLIPKLQACGFCGAMLDTQRKKQSIIDLQPKHILKNFTAICKQHNLMSGLSGSVGLQHLATLIALSPDFIGMRGGVCDADNRTLALSQKKVEAANAMLLKYNSDNGFGSQSPVASLQI